MLLEAEELSDLLGTEASPRQLLADPDAVPDLPDNPIIQPGDCWLLGPHRLICGDATNVEEAARLLNGDRAACLWTDPPYGVSYAGKTADALTIANDVADGLEGLLRSAFTAIQEVLVPGAPFYIAHPAGPLSLILQQVITALGWRIRQTLVWVKDSLVLGQSDYHLRHEPILYWYLPGGAGRRGRGGIGWYGDAGESDERSDRPLCDASPGGGCVAFPAAPIA